MPAILPSRRSILTAPSRSPSDRSEPKGLRALETRSRIIDSAIGEFRARGLAGARTEQIAHSAKVNKALLYYYFKSKDALYAAAIKTVASRMATGAFTVMSSD